MMWSDVLLVLGVWLVIAAVVGVMVGRLIQANDDGEDVACRAEKVGQATAQGGWMN